MKMVHAGTLFFPPDRRRLIIGLVLAVLAPLAVTPLVRDGGPLALVPGTAYLLAVVVATIFGRLAAAAVAIPYRWSCSSATWTCAPRAVRRPTCGSARRSSWSRGSSC